MIEDSKILLDINLFKDLITFVFYSEKENRQIEDFISYYKTHVTNSRHAMFDIFVDLRFLLVTSGRQTKR